MFVQYLYDRCSYSIANAAMAATRAPNLAPTARVSAPLAGALRGDDELVPGAVDDGDPVPEIAGVVALPVGYGATAATLEGDGAAGVLAGTAGMLGVYGAIEVDANVIELVKEIAEVEEEDDSVDVLPIAEKFGMPSAQGSMRMYIKSHTDPMSVS